MAREEKRIELRPVDDAPVLKANVLRLETDQTIGQSKPVRLGNQAESVKISARLDLPSREEIETRTHQPGIEVLMENESGAGEFFEEDWGKASTEQRHIPWGWFALIGLVLMGAVIWSLSQVNDSDPQVRQERMEMSNALELDAKEDLEASRLVDRIKSVTDRYFKAATIEEMLPLVRQPDRVRPLMESHYRAGSAIVPHQVVDTRRFEPVTLDHRANYWLTVVALDDGTTRNLIVDVLDPDEPRIDWETLVCYQPMDWDRFATERPAGTFLDFRVYVEADNFHSHEFADSSKWNCFRLTALGGEQTVFGYSKVGDEVSREMLELIQRNQGRVCSLILRIHIPEGLKSRSGAVIDKVMSPRWLYVEAPDSSS